MSLLNEMLKDLSENKSGVKATPSFIPRPKKPLLQTLPKIVLWLCGSLMLSFMILMIYHGISHVKKSSVTTKPPVIPPKTASATTNSQVNQVPQMKEHPSSAHRAPTQNVQTGLSYISPEAPAEAETSIVLPSQLVPIELSQERTNLEQNFPSANDNLIPDSAPEGITQVIPSPTTKEWHDLQLNQALEAIQEGDNLRAIHLLELILTKFPGSIDAHESLTAIYLSRSEYNKAIQTLDDGLVYEPHSLALNKMKAHILFEQDQPQEALNILLPFKPDMRREPDFYGLQAAILQTLGRANEAGSLYLLRHK